MLVGLIDEFDTACNWDDVQNILDEEGLFAGFPEPIIRAIAADHARPRHRISVSNLTGCLGMNYLKDVVDYWETPGRLLVPLMGTIAHGLLERGADAGYELVETPLMWMTGKGIWVHGTVDYMNLESRTIIDWKTTRWMKPENLPQAQHVVQVNMYRFLAEWNRLDPDGGVPSHPWSDGYSYGGFDHLKIVYIDLTGPARNGAHGGVVVVDIPIWDDEQMAGLIATRALQLHNAYDNGVLPPRATGSDRWLCNYCPAAVKQVCNSRA